MPYVQQGIIVGLVLLVTGMAWAGGSNYGITPGSRPQVEGKIHYRTLFLDHFEMDV